MATMKMIFRSILFGFFMIALLTSCFPLCPETAHNIIFMVGDGMGLSNVNAARIYKNGLDGGPLNMETLPVIGYQRTYSRNSTITDSASAASAWACGEKFDNGEICKHFENESYPRSILELAKEKLKATGLVATSTITHATPAAFGAHVTDRSCEKEIARQYIELTTPDVILGGGKDNFYSFTGDPCGTYGDFLREAKNNGYTLVYTGVEMKEAISQKVTKILGVFSNKNMVPEYKRTSDTREPKLHEMTAAALAVLDKNPQGFFLLVEGSQIDGGNHSNNFEYMVGELLAFDQAVRVVLEWINEKPERKKNTLLIITSDHEVGGFAIVGPSDTLPKKNDLNSIEVGWISRKHTGGDTIIWSQGPGSQKLGKALDNTDIYKVMVNAFK
jgi:alkaline phosphatase